MKRKSCLCFLCSLKDKVVESWKSGEIVLSDGCLRKDVEKVVELVYWTLLDMIEERKVRVKK